MPKGKQEETGMQEESHNTQTVTRDETPGSLRRTAQAATDRQRAEEQAQTAEAEASMSAHQRDAEAKGRAAATEAKRTIDKELGL